MDPQPLDTDGQRNGDLSVNLAVHRTEMALERTQLAWVRTAFTLITAGFAIDKATSALHLARVLAGTNWVDRSHVIGLVLIGCATVFLALASFGYVRQWRALNRLRSGLRPWLLLSSLPLSLLVVALGCTLFTFLLSLD